MKKTYIIALLVIVSNFLFVSCKKGEYKVEEGKLYHYHYVGVGVTHKGEVKGADLESFKQISELYGKDKNHAYRTYSLLPNSDPESFVIIDDIYSKDKNRVFYYSHNIPNADPSSFQIIEYGYSDKEYAKDKNYVFFRGEALPNADPKTFKYIKNGYAKDTNQVYYYDDILLKADVKTFKQIAGSMWKDKNYVFYGDSILPDADTQTMRQIGDEDDYWYADKNTVYHFADRLNVAPEEFEILNYCWGRSKTKYYFTHLPMDSLDYATAEILTEEGKPNEITPYIKDKSNVFYGTEKIKGADPKTFVIDNHFTAHDANHKYRAAKIVE